MKGRIECILLRTKMLARVIERVSREIKINVEKVIGRFVLLYALASVGLATKQGAKLHVMNIMMGLLLGFTR